MHILKGNPVFDGMSVYIYIYTFVISLRVRSFYLHLNLGMIIYGLLFLLYFCIIVLLY